MITESKLYHKVYLIHWNPFKQCKTKKTSFCNENYKFSLCNLSHLGRNPFFCDCKLAWLNQYFREKPVERSGITCSLPKRLTKKRIGTLDENTFRCFNKTKKFTPNNLLEFKDNADFSNNFCDVIEENCPEKCTCQGTIIECVSSNLTDFPKNLPPYTTEL